MENDTRATTMLDPKLHAVGNDSTRTGSINPPKLLEASGNVGASRGRPAGARSERLHAVARNGVRSRAAIRYAEVARGDGGRSRKGEHAELEYHERDEHLYQREAFHAGRICGVAQPAASHQRDSAPPAAHAKPRYSSPYSLIL